MKNDSLQKMTIKNMLLTDFTGKGKLLFLVKN